MDKVKVVNRGGSGDCQQRVLQYVLKLTESSHDIKKRQIDILNHPKMRGRMSKITKIYNNIDSYIPYIDIDTADKLYHEYNRNLQLNRGSEFWMLITASKVWQVQFRIYLLHRGQYVRKIRIRWCSKKCPIRGIVYDLHGLHYLAAERREPKKYDDLEYIRYLF